ncbi:MAG: beta-ketoacyl-ACP synthase II [Planctomycetota bacterium]|jgi:3-oxoacyl-[acyl-carrier-protein] synthase II|nr:beta-ketoacyl-ACP synthase II [Planctomycetota bacterium]
MPDAPKRRVVITGMGCVTPIGNDLETAWKGILEGKSGAGPITHFDHSAFEVHFAHEVKNFDSTARMDAKEAKRTDRFVHFALAAAKMASEMALLTPGSFDSERAGAVYASGIGGIRSIEDQYERYKIKGPKRISSFTIPFLMINDACGQLAIDFGLKGPNYATVSACSSSAHAIGLAMRHIQWGEADIMFTGGSEAGISILGLGAFINMGALSTRNDDPAAASRPFDRDRDGFVLGEGAGAVVLEELGHARARNAPILAEILGYGFTDDAHHITAPDDQGDGASRAMRRAIADSGLSPSDIGYVNAHGTSTPLNDRTEAAALKHVFGARLGAGTAVSSTKGHTGHLLGAAGAIEAIFTVMAIRDGVVPPTINFRTPDPECDIDVTPNRPRRKDIRYALSNNLGFGGHNASLCLARCDS